MNPAGVDIRILSALARGWGVGGNLKFNVACPPGFELAQGGVVFHFNLPLRLNGFQPQKIAV